MTPVLSAIICTHNPKREVLAETLKALRAQDLGNEAAPWELIVVDNASQDRLEDQIDLSWSPGARIIREERLGLVNARVSGYKAAQGEFLVYIDDDNVLAPSYLRLALRALQADPMLGAVGGKSLPRYEAAPPDWFAELNLDLACRDLGDQTLAASWQGLALNQRTYPICAPIGAGMALRREAYGDYLTAALSDPRRTSLGRRGADLASGEDNDMVLALLANGWTVAYLPQLHLEHLIPRSRLTRSYLASYAYASNRTWVQVLAVHGIQPWPPVASWTAGMRKVRAWLALRAWRSTPDFIRWRKACGLIDGRSRLM